MNHPTSGKSEAISHRLYLFLLVLCQSEFRRQFGQEMGQVFRDRCSEAIQRGGLAGLAWWWVEALLDLAGTAVATHVIAFEKGDLEMKRILRIIAQGVFGCSGILLLFYMMIKSPMPSRNAGILLCVVIACLSAALGLTWAGAISADGRMRK